MPNKCEGRDAQIDAFGAFLFLQLADQVHDALSRSGA